MNLKRIARPATPYNQEYTFRQVEAMHPAMRRQVYLDTNEMAMFAQVRIHNDAAGTIAEWMETLD